MAYKSENYTPNKHSQAILARGWEHVNSVPYQVTARWLFYQLLQEGHYKGKADYDNKFLSLLSRARHNFYGPWRPDTLADDRRTCVERGGGDLDVKTWAETLAEYACVSLAHWPGQRYYVELWFEAEAMKSQFEYYTRSIILRPFYGMPSIPYKWEIAQALERADRRYGLPIVVLYFGDMDEAGEMIPKTSVEDIRGWCGVEFEFVRAGLNPGDEVKYNIPENIEKPDAYQWEALNDDAARELITGAVGRYVDYNGMAQIENQEADATRRFRALMAEWVDGGLP